MKNIKLLGVLAALAIAAVAVFVMRNNASTESPSMTKSNAINLPFSKTSSIDSLENRRVAAVEIVYPRDGGGNERVAVVDIVYPRERVAAVDIVYPRIGEQGEFCGLGGPEFESITFKEITQFCDINETQTNQLIGVQYTKAAFCDCITKFCGIQRTQAGDFVRCLNQ